MLTNWGVVEQFLSCGVIKECSEEKYDVWRGDVAPLSCG